MSSEHSGTSYSTILVNYQAIVEIVLGILSLLIAVQTYLVTFDDDEFSFLYYWFIGGAIFVILKGSLLLQGIRKSCKNSVLLYFILTTFFILVLKGVVIYMGIDQYDAIEEIQQDSASESEMKHILRGFAFDFVVFYPSIFLLQWFIQFYVFQFYRKLAASQPVKENNINNGEKNY